MGLLVVAKGLGLGLGLGGRDQQGPKPGAAFSVKLAGIVQMARKQSNLPPSL